MTEKTPEEIAELNAHRQPGGQFGPHGRTDADPDVLDTADGNGYHDVTYPATVKVILEWWNYRDEAEEVGSVEFDARAIFDAKSLTSLQAADLDSDWVFYEAIHHGLADDHNGPFTVELPEDFDDYIEHREENGMTAPYETAAEGLAIVAAEANMERRRKALDEAQRYLEAAGEIAVVTKKISELNSGDVLVQGAHRLRVDEQPGPTSLVPGFWSVGTDFGYLYLDPDETISVEAL